MPWCHMIHGGMDRFWFGHVESFCTEIPWKYCLSKATEDAVEFIEEGIAVDTNGGDVFKPPAPSTSLLHHGHFGDWLISGCICSREISHKEIMMGRGWILKPDGICSGIEEWRRDVSSHCLSERPMINYLLNCSPLLETIGCRESISPLLPDELNDGPCTFGLVFVSCWNNSSDPSCCRWTVHSTE